MKIVDHLGCSEVVATCVENSYHDKQTRNRENLRREQGRRRKATQSQKEKKKEKTT